MSVTVRYLNRNLLKNVLHHVDTHNRLIEEKGMWDQKRKRKRDESSSSESEGGEYRSSHRRKSYGRMRSDSVSDSRAIAKQKAADGKWSHNGFMELYPDEFLDRQSMDEMSGSEGDRSEEKTKKTKKKKKRKRESSGDGRHRRKTRGSEKKPNAPEDIGRDVAPNTRLERIKWGKGRGGREPDDRRTSPRRHKHSEATRRSSIHNGNGDNNQRAGKNNRKRTKDDKRGGERDQRSDKLVSPGRHKRSDRNNSSSGKDSSRHRDREHRSKHLISPRKQKRSDRTEGPPKKRLPDNNPDNDEELRVMSKSSPRKHVHSRTVRESVNGNGIEVEGSLKEERTNLVTLENRKQSEKEEGSLGQPEEKFSDLEDEVFGLARIRAKLEKREQEMRRRMERRIERYGEGEEKERHRRRHKKKKRKKKVEDGMEHEKDD